MSEEARKREDDYYAGTMKDDYISRKAVLNMLNKECGSCADTGYIFSLPGIEKRKKGKWILTEDDNYEYCTCSECGYQNGENWMSGSDIPFCANCGADMRGDTDETD